MNGLISKLSTLDLSSYEGNLSNHPSVSQLEANQLVACIGIRKDKVTVNNQLIKDNGDLLLLYTGNLNFKTFNLFML